MHTQTFCRAINIAKQVVERRSSIPVLSELAMSPRPDGKVRLTGTNMDQQIDVEFDGEVDADLMLPAPATLATALGAFAASDTKIAPLPNDRQGVSIVSGDFNIELDSCSAKDLPVVGPIVIEHTAEVGQDFIKAMQQVRGAVSTEETRYYLNGVYIHKVAEPWTFAIVATDGHRLYIKHVPIPGFGEGEFTPFIMPRRFVDLALTILAKAGDNSITFAVGRKPQTNAKPTDLAPEKPLANVARFIAKVGDFEVTLTSRNIDGSFPDYKRVLPQDTPLEAVFWTKDLRKAVQALNAGASKKRGGARSLKIVMLRDLANISSSWDGGSGKATLQVPYEGNIWGKQNGNTVGVNAAYLLDALNTVNGAEEIRFQFQGGNVEGSYGDKRSNMEVSPMFITAKGLDDFKAVLMPMRV